MTQVYNAEGRHRVVVVGGGFGGLTATRNLEDADVDVTLVDRTNHHLFQPLLYQVAAGIISPGLIAPSLRSIVKKQRNARALLADVQELDLENNTVHAKGPDGRPVDLPYDTLIVAGGSTHSYFGRDEFADHAPGMKTVEDARHLRDQLLLAFEMAELATDPQEREEWLTFVVIGAGPTGVELVGQVAELAHKVLPKEYRSVNTREARILLLEGAPSVLPPFKPQLQKYTHATLEKMGVEIHTRSLAVDMDDRSVTYRGPDGETDTIRTRTRIWAAGVSASPLAKQIAKAAGIDTDRAGRIPVNPDCSVPGFPEVFAIGDMVSLNGVPGVAQPAMQEGKYVSKVLKARLAGGKHIPEPFEYFDKGSMATIGHRKAVADAFGLRFTGWIGYTMWGVIHLMYLIGWGNRLGTLYNWLRALTFGQSRPHRIITFEQAHDQAVSDQGKTDRSGAGKPEIAMTAAEPTVIDPAAETPRTDAPKTGTPEPVGQRSAG